jgi:uroporphyrinogen-III synthase
LDAALDELGAYAWLIFTSVNGVKYFFAFTREAARYSDTRIRAYRRYRSETARAVEEFQLRVDAIPTEYRAEALIPA